MGLAVRVGVYTGEVEFANKDVCGIAVHIASRVSDLGNANDVILSRTVKDLVVGSGIEFEDFGTHTLKSISDDWHLVRVRG